MDIRLLMTEEQKRLHQSVKELREKLAGMPEGNLYIVKNGKYSKWFLSLNGKKIFIPKSERELAKKMAVKKWSQILLRQSEQELEAVNAYLRNSSSDNADAFLEKHKEFLELVNSQTYVQDRIQNWINSPYPKNPQSYKGTLYRTLKGELVKSLAEKEIADALFLADIPYRYECGISFDNGKTWFYPDFTIMHPQTGEIYLWEHFGMSELGYYCRKNANKLFVYFENGYVPGLNLICTAETDKYKLTKSMIQRKIDDYLGGTIRPRRR